MPKRTTAAPPLLRPGFKGGGANGIAVVGVQNKRLQATIADSLAETGPANRICCEGRVLKVGEIPEDEFADPDGDHQVDVQSHAALVDGEEIWLFT